MNTGRFYVHFVEAEMKLTNSSNVGITLDIYEIVPRGDYDMTNTDITSPLKCWDNGYIDESPAGITGSTQSVLTSSVYGVKPMDSDLFTEYFVVKKIFPIELPASTTHVHKSRYNISRTFDSSSIQNSSLYGSIKHFTKWVLVIARGNPVHSSADSDIVGSSPLAVDATYSLREVTYGNVGSDTIAGITTGLPIPATPQVYGTPTTEQTVVVD